MQKRMQRPCFNCLANCHANSDREQDDILLYYGEQNAVAVVVVAVLVLLSRKYFIEPPF